MLLRTLHLTAPHLCSGRRISTSPSRDTAALGSDVGSDSTCGLGEGRGRRAGSRNGRSDVEGFALSPCTLPAAVTSWSLVPPPTRWSLNLVTGFGRRGIGFGGVVVGSGGGGNGVVV